MWVGVPRRPMSNPHVPQSLGWFPSTQAQASHLFHPTPNCKYQVTPRCSLGRASSFTLPSIKSLLPFSCSQDGVGGQEAGCLGLQQWLRLWLALLSLRSSPTPRASGPLRSSPWSLGDLYKVFPSCSLESAATKPHSALGGGGGAGAITSIRWLAGTEGVW